MDQNDYYSVLHVEPGATQEEVRAAYRRLAFLYHPDQSQNLQTTEQMQLLNEAYDVLSSPEKRAQYDQEQTAPLTGAPVHHPAPANAQAEVDLEYQKAQLHKRIVWIKGGLQVIVQLILVLTVLFFWSLASGQVSGIVILGFVILAVYVIATLVMRFKNLAE